MRVVGLGWVVVGVWGERVLVSGACMPVCSQCAMMMRNEINECGYDEGWCIVSSRDETHALSNKMSWTHYGSFWGRLLQPRWPNQVSKHWSWSSRSDLNLTRTTPACYNNTTLSNRSYAWRKGDNVTNPICWTCKNCSCKWAADCEHCVTQSSTEQFC